MGGVSAGRQLALPEARVLNSKELLAGLEIVMPKARADRPSPELLAWHAAELFRG
jgi:hypothetical protein